MKCRQRRVPRYANPMMTRCSTAHFMGWVIRSGTRLWSYVINYALQSGSLKPILYPCILKDFVTTQLPEQLRNRDRSVYAPWHEPSHAHRPRHPECLCTRRGRGSGLVPSGSSPGRRAYEAIGATRGSAASMTRASGKEQPAQRQTACK